MKTYRNATHPNIMAFYYSTCTRNLGHKLFSHIHQLKQNLKTNVAEIKTTCQLKYLTVIYSVPPGDRNRDGPILGRLESCSSLKSNLKVKRIQ